MAKTTVVDLSTVIDPALWEPEPVRSTTVDHKHGGDLLGRSYEFFRTKGRMARLLKKIGLGAARITHLDFPDQMGLSTMTYQLTTHTGTHLDAPYHYGWRSGGHGATTIDQVPLEWCFAPGVMLDISSGNTSHPVTKLEIAQALETTGHNLAASDIVLIRTGAEDSYGEQSYFTNYRGIEPDAISYLLDMGVRVIGTDAFSFDPPFCSMLDRYVETGSKAELWPAHILGRDRPYVQIERLFGLRTLPQPTGFKVSCFPVKLLGADAAWSRVVAIYNDH